MKKTSREQGQTLLEFAICLPLVLIAGYGAFNLLWTEWKRLSCATHAFQATHAHLIGDSLRTLASLDIRFEEDREFIQGTANCGSFSETVKLRKLEPDL